MGEPSRRAGPSEIGALDEVYELRLVRALCDAGPADQRFGYARCVAPDCSCHLGKALQARAVAQLAIRML